MKKIISLFVLITAILLSACAGRSNKQNELVGYWVADIDLAGVYCTGFDANAHVQLETDLNLKDYMHSLIVPMYLDIKVDGTFSRGVENYDDAVVRMKTQLSESLRSYYLEYFRTAVVAGLQDDGIYDVNSFEEIEEYAGMTVEEIVESANGVSIDAVVAESTRDEVISTITSGWFEAGKYRVSNGNLYMSNSLDSNINPAIYETYVLNGDRLTLTGSSDDGEFDDMFYPIVFHRVS